MVIKGKTRGNGKQLGEYLIDKGKKVNDFVTVLEVKGSTSRNPKFALVEMSLAGELTKGEKSLYHAQINPAIGEDKPMTYDHWLFAADSLEKELKLDNQNRVIVLHEKKGRVHAHVVWQREKDGKLISDSHSYKAHDRARATIEKKFRHNRTRQKFDEKQILTQAWNMSKDGREFIQTVNSLGYSLGKSNSRRPFVLINDNGIELDLTRQLQGIKLKDVENKFSPIINEINPIEKVKVEKREAQIDLRVIAKENSDNIVNLDEARKQEQSTNQKKQEFMDMMNQNKDKSKDRGFSW